MIISASAMSRTIEDTAAKLGAELPKPFVADLEAIRALVPAAAGIEGLTAHLNAAALTALREKRDPGADSEVQRLAALVTLAGSGIRHFTAEYANDAIAEAIATHSASILTSYGKAIANDLTVLMDAAGQLDMNTLDVPDMVPLRRAGKLNVWADASAASERADIALGGARTVLSILNLNPGPEYRIALLSPDCTLGDFLGANAIAGPREVNAWTIARTRAPLRLISSVTEFTEAVGRITAAQQEQQRQADEAEAEAKPEGRQRQRTWTKIR